jgi:uncharacterized membrane protein YfcA
MLKNYTINRLLALIVGIGFAVLTVDSILEHWDVLTKEPMSFVPVVFSAIGAVIGFLAVFMWNEKWIRTLHLFLFVSFLVAALGLYFHIKEDDDEESTGQKTEQGQKEKEKPAIAPLAFAGLAAVGLIGTARKWPAEVVQK